jgi:hypothetical protein
MTLGFSHRFFIKLKLPNKTRKTMTADTINVKKEKDTVNNKKFGAKFGVNQEKILSLIENMPTITVSELAKMLGIFGKGN